MSSKHSSGFFPLERRAPWDALTLAIGFTAILFWWVAVLGIGLTRSAGSAVFLLAPVLATIATLVSLRHASRSRAGNSLLP